MQSFLKYPTLPEQGKIYRNKMDCMKCPKCGAKIVNGTVCPECGQELPKKKFKWWYVVVLIAVIAVLGNAFGDDKSDSTSPSPASSSVAASELASQSTKEGAVSSQNNATDTAEPTSVDMELTSGNYLAGTDFPAGTYDLVAVKGGGNVSSDNCFSGGINAVMGIADKNSNGINMYEQEYSNIKLPTDTTLSISGVTIRITCENADGSPLSARDQSITDSVELGNGNFVAGTDFPAGVYDIEAISGGGNVSSDNSFSGGINAIMGTEDKNSGGIDMYEQTYQHIDFSDGTTLSIDGVKIRLTPSK